MKAKRRCRRRRRRRRSFAVPFSSFAAAAAADSQLNRWENTSRFSTSPSESLPLSLLLLVHPPPLQLLQVSRALANRFPARSREGRKKADEFREADGDDF